MILSIILPVYNIEKFVNRCIHSILDHASPDALFEIIAVNDGSTDNSLQKLLAINDNRLRVVDQLNAGVSAARNIGLQEATGKYVWFIDPDDYLSKGFIMEVYNLIISKSPELLLFGIHWVGEDTTYGSRVYKTGEYSVAELMEARIFDSNVWSRVVKKQLLDKHNIRFIDVINGEDFDFCIKVLCQTQKVLIPSVIGYNYLIHPEGSSKKRGKEHLEKLALDSLKTLDQLQAYFKSSEINLQVDSTVFNPWLNNYLFGLLFSLYRFKYDLSFVKNVIDHLDKNDHYPIAKEGLGAKQQLFIATANKKIFFLNIIKFKRLFTWV